MPVTRPSIITTGGNISGSGLPSDPVGTKPDLSSKTLLLTSTSISAPLSVSASIAGFAEINIKNDNATANASSDVVATANNGSDTQYFIDMGINSSTFNGSVGSASDGYLYNTGSHLWIGNATPNKNIYFFAGAVPSAATATPTMMISASAPGDSGRVGIGTDRPAYNLQIGNTTASGYKIGLVAPSSSTISEINFGRSSSLSTEAADTYRGIVGYNHSLDSLYFSQNGTRAITISGSQNIGIGTTTPTAKLTVNGDIHVSGANNITFASSGQGIIFAGNAIAGYITDNNLNDYEEGRWNPVLSGSTNAGSYTGTITGSYIKIGKQVFISGHLQISSTGSAAGGLSITGLPYSSLSYGLSAGSRVVAYIGMMPNSFQSVTTRPVIYGQISNASSRISLHYYYSGQQAALQTSDTNNSFNLYFSGVYPTDS